MVLCMLVPVHITNIVLQILKGSFFDGHKLLNKYNFYSGIFLKSFLMTDNCKALYFLMHCFN